MAALRKANTEIGVYTPIDTSSSSKHLTSIKERINKIVAQEIEFLEFKDKYAAEGLAESQYKEVVTNSNFYFGIDEQKKHTNKRLYDFKAPGNKYRTPSVLSPHEHVNIEKYIDIDGNDSD